LVTVEVELWASVEIDESDPAMVFWFNPALKAYDVWMGVATDFDVVHGVLLWFGLVSPHPGEELLAV